MPRNSELELMTVTKEGLHVKSPKVKNGQIHITKAIKIFKGYMKSFHIFYEAWLKCK